ncbi:MAG: hypothetical protein V1914_00155 [archaeon]
MKREVMLILIIALLAQTATALTINELTRTPADAAILTSADVSFHCETDTPAQITLHTDISGTLEANYTTTDTPLDYTINNIANGAYTWKCAATGGIESTVFGFTVNAIIPGFTGTIPDQNLNAGEALPNAFDLDDYFTDTTKVTVSGNTTITITIGTDNQVSLTAANATTETLTFTSGTAVSNEIIVTVADGALSCQTIPDQTWLKNENTTIALIGYCSGTKNITFSAPTVTSITTTIVNGTATLIPGKDWTGITSIIFTATAGSITTKTNNITLTVKESTPQVEITSYEPQNDPELAIGDIQVFTITKSGNGTLTVKWYIDNVLADGEAGDSYTYTNTKEGSHTIKSVVSDGTNEATRIWTITVAEPESEPDIETESLLGEQTQEPECGDNICEADENCGNCEEDCACGKSEICQANTCIEKSGNKTLLIAIMIIVLIIAGGGTITYLLITKKPEGETKEETNFEKVQLKPAADISDFYKKTSSLRPLAQKPATTQPKKPVATYITSMRAKGATDDKIKAELKAKGWNDQQIAEAFNNL